MLQLCPGPEKRRRREAKGGEHWDPLRLVGLEEGREGWSGKHRQRVKRRLHLAICTCTCIRSLANMRFVQEVGTYTHRWRLHASANKHITFPDHGGGVFLPAQQILCWCALNRYAQPCSCVDAYMSRSFASELSEYGEVQIRVRAQVRAERQLSPQYMDGREAGRQMLPPVGDYCVRFRILLVCDCSHSPPFFCVMYMYVPVHTLRTGG